MRGLGESPLSVTLRIQSGIKNLLLTRVGLPRKLPSKFEFELNGNAELNKYMAFQINRAIKARDDSQGTRDYLGR